MKVRINIEEAKMRAARFYIDHLNAVGHRRDSLPGIEIVDARSSQMDQNKWVIDIRLTDESMQGFDPAIILVDKQTGECEFFPTL